MSKISKLGQAFSKGDAKKRVFLIAVVIIFIVFVFILISKMIGVTDTSFGSTDVSKLPKVDSIQGGSNLSPNYKKALEEGNQQLVQNAMETHTSAVATIINSSDAVAPQAGCVQCCNTCGGGSIDQAVDSMFSDGNLTQASANALKSLAALNLSPEDYAAHLARLVQEGKLTPEQARKLLAAYQSQYEDKIAKNGAKDLDPLIKTGQLPVDAASKLLDLQKQNLSPSSYADELQRMVDASSVSPGEAAALLKKYKAQREERLDNETKAQLAGMVKSKEITQGVADTLRALQDNNAPVGDYATTLERLAKDNKLTPEQAARLLAQYKKQHGVDAASDAGVDNYASSSELPAQAGEELRRLQASNVSVATFAEKLQELVKTKGVSTASARRILTQYQAEFNAKEKVIRTLEQLSTEGKVTASALNQLKASAKKNDSLASFSKILQALADQGQVASVSVQEIISEYNAAIASAAQKDQLLSYLESKKKLPEEAATTLSALQAKSASVGDYAAALQKMVEQGLISPETAKALLAAYRAKLASGASGDLGNFTSATIDRSIPLSGNKTLDRVTQAAQQQQARSQQRSQYTAAVALNSEQQVAAAQQKAQLVQARMQKMYDQAKKFMTDELATPEQKYQAGTVTQHDQSASSSEAASLAAAGGSDQPPIIKAGTILYAVLDTAVNSDYADSPVMATITSGTFKGAKLLGSIKTVKNGQRVLLQFTQMNMNAWAKSKEINAFAIDPNTARSALATDVNNHYWLRYGALFATSFIQGMGQAISESGTSVSSNDGVVTSSTTDLNTQEKVLVALGTVGENASAEVGKLANTPPTVKVEAGIGLGILFMSGVTEVEPAAQAKS